jgi:hypothetical protein
VVALRRVLEVAASGALLFRFRGRSVGAELPRGRAHTGQCLAVSGRPAPGGLVPSVPSVLIVVVTTAALCGLLSWKRYMKAHLLRYPSRSAQVARSERCHGGAATGAAGTRIRPGRPRFCGGRRSPARSTACGVLSHSMRRLNYPTITRERPPITHELPVDYSTSTRPAVPRPCRSRASPEYPALAPGVLPPWCDERATGQKIAPAPFPADYPPITRAQLPDPAARSRPAVTSPGLAERMSGQKVALLPARLAPGPYGSLTDAALRQRYGSVTPGWQRPTTDRLPHVDGLAVRPPLHLLRGLTGALRAPLALRERYPSRTPAP